MPLEVRQQVVTVQCYVLDSPSSAGRLPHADALSLPRCDYPARFQGTVLKAILVYLKSDGRVNQSLYEAFVFLWTCFTLCSIVVVSYKK